MLIQCEEPAGVVFNRSLFVRATCEPNLYPLYSHEVVILNIFILRCEPSSYLIETSNLVLTMQKPDHVLYNQWPTQGTIIKLVNSAAS